MMRFIGGAIAIQPMPHDPCHTTHVHTLTIPAVYRHWTSVISRFLLALQDLRMNSRHRRRTVDELATTLHFIMQAFK